MMFGQETQAGLAWHEIVCDTLKRNSVQRADVRRNVRARAHEDGPWLIAVRIDDNPGVGATERDPVLITDRFMRGTGTKG
jgi:hypothetical protein